MAEAGLSHGTADEGGHWPEFESNEDALDMLVRAIERAGLQPAEQVAISLDVAASEFEENGRYRLARDGRELDSDGVGELLGNWIGRFPIVSVEDPLGEDDIAGLARFTQAYGERVQIVGDDALVTSAARVTDAAQAGACNAVLLKPNQAGTLSECRAAFDAARDVGYDSVASARSGETEDTTIVHLAAAGACRSSRSDPSPTGSVRRSGTKASASRKPCPTAAGSRTARLSLGENAVDDRRDHGDPRRSGARARIGVKGAVTAPVVPFSVSTGRTNRSPNRDTRTRRAINSPRISLGTRAPAP